MPESTIEQFRWPVEWKKAATKIAKRQGKTRSEWIRDQVKAAIEAEGKTLKVEAPKRGGARKGSGPKPATPG